MTNNALVEFALTVLDILERDRDWSPNTLDAIQIEAQEHGLGTTDDEGYFKVVTPKTKRAL